MDFFKEFGKQVSNVARSVTDRSKESAEAIIAGYFGLSDAQKRHIGVNYAKQLF